MSKRPAAEPAQGAASSAKRAKHTHAEPPMQEAPTPAPTDKRRIETVYTAATAAKDATGPVVYWMSRDQRCADNWALVHGQELALAQHQPLVVVFNMVPDFLGATQRQYGFMVRGLKQLELKQRELAIPMFLLLGEPATTVPAFVAQYGASHLIADFSPLRISKTWKRGVAEALRATSSPCSFHVVDAHNIVPVRVVSDKQETAARTIRPKINALLGEWLLPIPPTVAQHERVTSWVDEQLRSGIDWTQADDIVARQAAVPEVDWLQPGEAAAHATLERFIARLPSYQHRNNPDIEGVSHLSPYFHFGQIAPQAVALKIKAIGAKSTSAAQGAAIAAFLEEMIVRRELTDNFCHYNPHYDSFAGFAAWARETLTEHAKDARAHLYTDQQFEDAQTHDPLWNACQLEMVHRGKMHGFLRMYWAKKILEWSASPQDALRIAILLNDKYELDGRDPNGYVGCAWAIGGVHDMGFGERTVFGKIRYMNYDGCKRKFPVANYIQRMYRLAQRRVPDLNAKSSSSGGSTKIPKAATSAKSRK